MKVGSFLTHDILVGTFGRSQVQQTAKRLREAALIRPFADIDPHSAAAILFGLTFDSTGELTGTLVNKRNDFNEVTSALAEIFSDPEKLKNVESIEFYPVGMKVRFDQHSFFAGTSMSSYFFKTTTAKGDWIRLYAQATKDDRFLSDTF